MAQTASSRQWRKILGSGSLSNPFRHLAKLVLPSIFDTHFVLDDVKLAELSINIFERKCKIMTFIGEESEHNTAYFQGFKTPTPGSTPLLQDKHTQQVHALFG